MTLEPKLIRARPPITVATRIVKRYDVTVTDEPIRADVEAAALAMLPDLVPVGDGSPEAGWVVIHEGGDRTAMYVSAYSWVWDNVVEVRAAVAAQPHLDSPDDDPTNFRPVERPWAGCMWELIPFGHERTAWVQHVFGSTTPDLGAYLTDTHPDGWSV